MGARRPPNSFQRWVAEHPWLWVLTLSLIGVLTAFGAIDGTTEGFVIVFGLALVAAYAIAGGVGALLARWSVRRYDSRSGSA
jgi:hypothetical protein